MLLVAAILAFPSRAWLPRLRPLVVNLASLASLMVLMNAGDLVMPTAEAAGRDHMVGEINTGIAAVLAIVSIVTVGQTVYEAIRLVRSGRL
jgi:hypothetical protein